MARCAGSGVTLGKLAEIEKRMAGALRAGQWTHDA
jgi:hypothetical protein